MTLRALIFDVDGTLAETEEVHRTAFNAAFVDARLAWHWDIGLYGHLLKITGGKERMRHYAQSVGDTIDESVVAQLHASKNARYAQLIQEGTAPLRPGVEALIYNAHQLGLRLAIATTTSRANVEVLLGANLGARMGLFEVIVAGDEVAHKKPAPDAYLKALAELGVDATDCLAFEDSRNGVVSALTAGLRVVVTPGIYTLGDDFTGATHILQNMSEFELSKNN